MSRSGYSDDCDNDEGQYAMWRGQVASAIRGKRGQTLLRDMLAALDTMPEKQLFKGHLVTPEGGVCALGALGQARGVEMSAFEKFIDIDGYVDDPQSLADNLSATFDAASQLIQEIQYMNDEAIDYVWDIPNPDLRPGQPHHIRRAYTPEERWQKMREWVAKQIKS